MVLGREKRVKLLGVPLDNIPTDDFESVTIKLLRNMEPNRVVILDFDSFMRERKKIPKDKVLTDASLVITTSKAVAWGVKKIYGLDSVRFYPFSFVINMLTILERENATIYLLGGSTGEIHKVFNNIKSTFPEIRIVGRYKAFESSTDEHSVLMGMKKAGANFTIVGTKIRKGDRWIESVIGKLAKGIFIYSPLVFNIMSGKTKVNTEKKWLKQTKVSIKTLLNPLKWLKSVNYVLFFVLIINEKRKRKNRY